MSPLLQLRLFSPFFALHYDADSGISPGSAKTDQEVIFATAVHNLAETKQIPTIQLARKTAASRLLPSFLGFT